jgi:hypothetical protein
MKYCPACNFSFPDFHHVCDFDGTELVSEPERQALIKVRPSRWRSALKSPAFLSVALAIVLLSSAIIIGYLENSSAPAERTQAAANSPSDAGPGNSDSELPPARQIRMSHRHQRKLATLPATNFRRAAISARSVAKPHQTSIAGPTQKPEVARSRQPQQFSSGSTTNAPAAVKVSQAPARTSAPQSMQFSASRNLEPASHPKDPKLTAVLKSTWHVLKKPFKF